MSWLVTKYLTTALVVVLVSEIAKRSDKLGALVAALPLVTILALIWLQIETGSAEKVYRTIRPVVLILVGFRPAMQLFEGFLRLDPGMIHQD